VIGNSISSNSLLLSGGDALGLGSLAFSFSIVLIVSSMHLPETTAYVRITQHSWQQGKIEGEVQAAEYEWQFQWCFREVNYQLDLLWDVL
jgi:hypothetical protein